MKGGPIVPLIGGILLGFGFLLLAGIVHAQSYNEYPPYNPGSPYYVAPPPPAPPPIQIYPKVTQPFPVPQQPPLVVPGVPPGDLQPITPPATEVEHWFLGPGMDEDIDSAGNE